MLPVLLLYAEMWLLWSVFFNVSKINYIELHLFYIYGNTDLYSLSSRLWMILYHVKSCQSFLTTVLHPPLVKV